MKKELKNSNLKRCGKVLTELLETIWEELSSENLSCVKTSPYWFLNGKKPIVIGRHAFGD